MRIVVVGAGYAGTIAANRVASKVKSAEVTVVNPRPDFVERIRLHQQIAGTGTAATPLTSMLRDGITPLVGTVDKIGDGTVALADGGRVDFDYAFLAVGSTPLPMHGTVPVGTWETAEQARVALEALPTGSMVTVIGGGPTGIETAAEIAGARPEIRVRLIGPSVAETFSPAAQERVRAGLQRLQVEIVEDAVTEATAGANRFDGALHLRSGTTLSSDLTLWATVSGLPDLAARSGLEVDSEGRAVVDEFLRSVTDERIFAVGDCAAVPGSRFACYTAQPQGIHAAESLARLVAGRAPEPYSLGYLALCVSLGRNDAVAQFTRRDDTPRRAYLGGRTGAVLKETVSRVTKFAARTGGRGFAWAQPRAK